MCPFVNKGAKNSKQL